VRERAREKKIGERNGKRKVEDKKENEVYSKTK
jgi:hypothetical protein